MRIVCISDTHLMHTKYRFDVPDGDVLIHAGDATFQGRSEEIRAFSTWFGRLPHKRKIFVAGNHDLGFQFAREEAISLLPKKCHYLEDSGVEIDGVKFWGSPWQPEFFNWAFNLPRGQELKKHWDLIPADTNVLITHSPPFGIGDWVERGEHVGCMDMLDAIRRVQPAVHVCGHIHGGYGRHRIQNMEFINASICNEAYQPVNAPFVVDL